MPGGFTFGRVDCTFCNISVLVFPYISPCKFIPFSHFSACTVTDLPVLFCAWAGILARDLPKSPPRQLVPCLILHPASVSLHPACIFLPVSCHMLFYYFFFSQKLSVKFSPSFHISKAWLFLNFTVNFFSLPLKEKEIFFFLFWSTLSPAWIPLNFSKNTACSLQGLEKLHVTSPTHLCRGEAPLASSRLTPHDLIQNPDSDKIPLEINDYIG